LLWLDLLAHWVSISTTEGDRISTNITILAPSVS
jgi:hypothetical protein